MQTELFEFTRHALERGATRDEIAGVLRAAGWPDAEIGAALDGFAGVSFGVPVPRPKPYLSAREVFTYLGLFAALYVTVWNLGSLAFALIDHAFPDPPRSSARYDLDAMRWNVASLVVVFPLFLLLFRTVSGWLARDPTKRGSKPRKWLTYATLLIAGATAAGDLVNLVYHFLGGDLTNRFVLKSATVAALAGCGFLYFLLDMRRDER